MPEHNNNTRVKNKSDSDSGTDVLCVRVCVCHLQQRILMNESMKFMALKLTTLLLFMDVGTITIRKLVAHRTRLVSDASLQ